MKIYLIVLSVLYASLSFGQETRTICGAVVDTSGQAVANTVIVLMTRSDSTQLKLDYFQTWVFELKWADKEDRDVMLYISAIGYNSRSPRGISIGISYNFNNFKDLFQKNESGSDMIKRAKID